MRIILIMRELGRQAGLEWVLMMSFDRPELAALVLGSAVDREVSRWPSSFYVLAAARVRKSAAIRRRVSVCLEPRLEPFFGRYRDASPIELCENFRAAACTFEGREMAAVLWILFLRGQPSTDLLCRRLAREAQVAATRWLGASAGLNSYLDAQGSPEADRLVAIG